MEEIIAFLGKGVVRIMAHILLELFFNTLCYWASYPICKALTLGKYPTSLQTPYITSEVRHDFWCSGIGFLVILFGCYISFGVFG